MVDDVEIVTEPAAPAAPAAEAPARPANGITAPDKLMRIAVMLRGLQEEVRRAAPDEAGRAMLRQLHERALQELCEVLSPDLQEELKELSLPFSDDTPTESEILIGQAQLVGWLEGLFQGIQVTLFNQQLQAKAQFEQMRQRGLPPGQGGAPAGAPDGEPGPAGGPAQSTGQYL